MNYRDFTNACRQALNEEAPTSDAPIFGFITPTGKVLKGEPGIDLHPLMARALGFKGDLPEKKAVVAGYVRYAVGADGDASFEFVPKKDVLKRVYTYIKKTHEIIGTVYVDLLTVKGRNLKQERWSVDKALQMIPRIAILA